MSAFYFDVPTVFKCQLKHWIDMSDKVVLARTKKWLPMEWNCMTSIMFSQILDTDYH